MTPFRVASVLVALALALPCLAQSAMHPNMGMVPPHPTDDTLFPAVPGQRGPLELSLGYGAYNRFTTGRTDFGYIDREDTPPYALTTLRLDVGLSYYAGSYVPDRPGTPGMNGGIYALTGGPNAGGAVPGLYWIDPSDGAEMRLGDADPGFPTFGWTGMAFDPSSDRLFAIATDCMGTSDLYSADPPFTAFTKERRLTGAAICPINLMIDSAGDKYTLDVGLTQTNDFMYRIGVDFAMTALPNDVGFDAGFAQGGAYNSGDEQFYLAAIRVERSPLRGAPEGELRVLSRAITGELTGSTTLLGPFEDDGNIEGNFFTFPFPSTVANEAGRPTSFDLSEAYPNPFNPSAGLTLRVADTQRVRATLHDALGRSVRVLHDGVVAGGQSLALRIDAQDLPSGVYRVRVLGERFTATRTATLLR